MEFAPVVSNFELGVTLVVYNIDGVRWVMQMRSIAGVWIEYSFWTKRHYATRVITVQSRKHLFTRTACIVQSKEGTQIARIELEMRTSETPINHFVEALLGVP